MKKNLHILFLVPIWYWIFIPFIPNFFSKFPYKNRNTVKKWYGEVYLDSCFRSTQKSSFEMEDKLYKAYIKLRIEALKVSNNYPQSEFGISYSLGESNGSC